METALLWWSITWENNFPVYTRYMKTEAQCMNFIAALYRETGYEMLGTFEDSSTCRIVIFHPSDSLHVSR